MSDFINRIENVLNSNILTRELITVPDEGVSEFELLKVEKTIGMSLPNDYKKLLKRYNGIDLELFQIFGLGNTKEFIKELTEQQSDIPYGFIAIGDSPAGFIYLTDLKGQIWSFDTKSGDSTRIALSLDEFITKLVFGTDADKFAGQEWKEELINADIIK